METTVQLKVEKQADRNCKMENYMTEVSGEWNYMKL
jgi:hypothetical protein